MARPPNDRFNATAHLSPVEHERTLFARVCDAIGATAAYVAHDIMPDVRSKLIDEGWFGRPAAPAQSHGSPSGAPWRTPNSLTIEGEFTRSQEPSKSHDHDIER